MNWEQPIYEDKVHTHWLDFNEHMTDAAYAIVFGKGVGQLMKKIGIDEEYVKTEKFTIYTLENHILYIKETLEGEPFKVYLQLVAHDEKRLHVFFTMYSEKGEKLAVSEQMLICIDQRVRRSAPFPKDIYERILSLKKYSDTLPEPKELGRVISL